LITNRIHRPVNHPTIVTDDLVDGIALGEIDRDTAYLFGGGEALGNSVDDVDERRTAQDSGVSGHQTDGACTEDSDAFAGLESGDFDAVPA
jgi:hypothetical protein